MNAHRHNMSECSLAFKVKMQKKRPLAVLRYKIFHMSRRNVYCCYRVGRLQKLFCYIPMIMGIKYYLKCSNADDTILMFRLLSITWFQLLFSDLFEFSKGSEYTPRKYLKYFQNYYYNGQTFYIQYFQSHIRENYTFKKPFNLVCQEGIFIPNLYLSPRN